jgi:hypothetical protein
MMGYSNRDFDDQELFRFDQEDPLEAADVKSEGKGKGKAREQDRVEEGEDDL